MYNATWQLAYLFRKAKTAHASGPVLCARARKRSMTPQPISHGNMPASYVMPKIIMNTSGLSLKNHR